MIQHFLVCKCGREEKHGLAPPLEVQTCCTARAIRAGCKEYGCKFEVVEREAELSDVDELRLGLREDRALVTLGAI